MYPDLQTDLYNLDSVENNLRHSANGSLDAYDVTHSLTVEVKLGCSVAEADLSRCSKNKEAITIS